MTDNTAEKKKVPPEECKATLSLGKKIQLSIVGATALATIVVASFAVLKIFTLHPAEPKPVVSPPHAEIHSEPTSYELKDVGLSFPSRSGTRLAQVQMTVVFDLPDENAKNWLTMNRALLLDIIYATASHFSQEQVKIPSGVTTFRDALREALRARLKPYEIIDLHLKDWVLR